MQETKTATPAQAWAAYLDAVKGSPTAWEELPTIRNLADLERMDEEERALLFLRIKRVMEGRTGRTGRAKEFLALLGANEKRGGVAYAKEREHKKMIEAYKNMSTAQVHKYIYSIKRAKKSLYFMMYSSDRLERLNYNELKDLDNAIFQKIFDLLKTAHTVQEFTISYKDMIIVFQKFKKDDLQILSHNNLISLHDLIAKKEEKERLHKRSHVSKYLVMKFVREFFENFDF